MGRGPLRWAVPAALLILAAVALLAVPGEDTARAVAAIVVGGVGGILAVAGVFYEIGRSEDRDREREAARRRRSG